MKCTAAEEQFMNLVDQMNCGLFDANFPCPSRTPLSSKAARFIPKVAQPEPELTGPSLDYLQGLIEGYKQGAARWAAPAPSSKRSHGSSRRGRSCVGSTKTAGGYETGSSTTDPKDDSSHDIDSSTASLVDEISENSAEVQEDHQDQQDGSPAESLPVKHTFIHYEDVEEPKGTLRRCASAPGCLLGMPHAKLEGEDLARYEEKVQMHDRGECRPCAFFLYKEDGCRWGQQCAFCHLCPKGEIKARRKMRYTNRRSYRGRHGARQAASTTSK